MAMQVKSLARCLGWRHCVQSWQLLVVVKTMKAGEIIQKAYMVGRKWASNVELWRSLIVKGCTKGEEYEGQAIKCLASELCVLTAKVDVSEVIHFVTIDVVGKAPALYTAKWPGSVLLKKHWNYTTHWERKLIYKTLFVLLVLFIGILLYLCVYFIPVYLRCIVCYFGTFIFCNMFASQAIFIMLHYYSTILLSVFIILCISQDLLWSEVGEYTIYDEL